MDSKKELKPFERKLDTLGISYCRINKIITISFHFLLWYCILICSRSSAMCLLRSEILNQLTSGFSWKWSIKSVFGPPFQNAGHTVSVVSSSECYPKWNHPKMSAINVPNTGSDLVTYYTYLSLLVMCNYLRFRVY